MNLYPAAAAAACCVVAATALTGGGGSGPAGSATHRLSVSAAGAGTVDLRAAPGQLIVTGTSSAAVTLAGQLDWKGREPVVTSHLDRSTGVLALSYQCAAASPCTGNYRLVVPRRMAVELHQPSGHAVISGLTGPLSVTAASVDVSATGLRCPALTASITSGHLSAAFDTQPQRVAITLRSAQATLLLPAREPYAISSQVTSGYIGVGIPHTVNASHIITARIYSGELSLRVNH